MLKPVLVLPDAALFLGKLHTGETVQGPVVLKAVVDRRTLEYGGSAPAAAGR